MQPISSFTAIDVETAQGQRNSICQIGLVRIVDGVVTGKIELLVKPPDNKYHYTNIRIHGITPEMTENAPTFDKVWPIIEPFIRNQHVVAHNGSFDFNCLEKTLSHYHMKTPSFQAHCTYKIFDAALDVCCQEHNIELDHHNALSDAMACAELFLLHLDNESGYRNN